MSIEKITSEHSKIYKYALATIHFSHISFTLSLDYLTENYNNVIPINKPILLFLVFVIYDKKVTYKRNPPTYNQQNKFKMPCH